MANILKISICILLCLKTMKCCDCNLNEMIKDTMVKGSQNTMEKRQMIEDEEDDAGWVNEGDSFEKLPTGRKEDTIKERKQTIKSTEGTENPTENPIENTTEATEQKTQNECKFFKEGPESNFENMVDDVWKIAFYKASETLSCIKIYIKTTSVENRSSYKDMYGDFNGTIDWKNCRYEVTSSARRTSSSIQRHFLQGTTSDKGVFKNVIVRREEIGDTVTLLEQSSNQWLVVKNLLLMRDCDNGEVFVFSRLPIEPSLRDIKEALAIFGEDTAKGTLACETLRNPKYETLS